MTTSSMLRSCFVLGVLGCAILLTPAKTHGQTAVADAEMAGRPLATREGLQAAAAHLGQVRPVDSALVRRIQARLHDGDFRPGDLVQIQVDSEPGLSKTFTVDADRSLKLPSPTVGSLSLVGTLRSELEPKVVDYISRFIRNPVVEAHPAIRVSIQGEVAHAGFYGVPADAVLADALMAAGGTTPLADMEKSSVERDGKKIWEGKALERVLANGQTLDEAGVRPGDQIVIARREPSHFSDNLRLFATVISIAGGLYGLSRALHHP